MSPSYTLLIDTSIKAIVSRLISKAHNKRAFSALSNPPSNINERYFLVVWVDYNNSMTKSEENKAPMIEAWVEKAASKFPH